MNYKSFLTHKALQIVLIILFSIWTMPWPLQTADSGLDPSWIIGINMAVSNDLQFGQDIAFTLGPLGYLYNSSYIDHTLWFQSLIFALFTHFLFIFSIALLIDRLSIPWDEYFVVFSLLLIPIHYLLDFKLLLSVVILFYLIATHKFKQEFEVKVLLFGSILLAIASLIKFNMLISSLSILIAFSLICICSGHYKKSLISSISYIAFVPLLWVMVNQHLANLPMYLLNGYRISSGYSDAMATSGPEWEIYLGLIGIVFTIVLFIQVILKKDREMGIFMLLSIGLLFVAFKHGFVRHDGGHVYGFFATYATFFICAYVICKNGTCHAARVCFVLLAVLFIGTIYSGTPGIMGYNIVQKVPAYELSWSLISDKSYQSQASEYAKNNIKYDYSLNNKTLNYLNGKTMDIFPWDIALVWAYNLDWSPRPVFQSYAAYTKDLDDLNAQHFSKDDAPEAILYSYKSIDGRYPFFDEPRTLTNILLNYTFVNQSGEFMLLSHNSYENTSRVEEDLGTVRVEIGQPVKIPMYDSGYVFGHIELEYSTFGKFMKFIYKPALAHIKFKPSYSGYSKEIRFIPGTSMNGVFLSQFIRVPDDLVSVFSGNITQDISEIIISVDNPSHYNKDISVHFVGVPSKTSVGGILEPSINQNVSKSVESEIGYDDVGFNT